MVHSLEITETISGIKDSPYEVTGLTNGKYYFVVAVNEHGDSSIWNERTITFKEVSLKDFLMSKSFKLKVCDGAQTCKSQSQNCIHNFEWRAVEKKLRQGGKLER